MTGSPDNEIAANWSADTVWANSAFVANRLTARFTSLAARGVGRDTWSKINGPRLSMAAVCFTITATALRM